MLAALITARFVAVPVEVPLSPEGHARRFEQISNAWRKKKSLPNSNARGGQQQRSQATRRRRSSRPNTLEAIQHTLDVFRGVHDEPATEADSFDNHDDDEKKANDILAEYENDNKDDDSNENKALADYVEHVLRYGPADAPELPPVHTRVQEQLSNSSGVNRWKYIFVLPLVRLFLWEGLIQFDDT